MITLPEPTLVVPDRAIPRFSRNGPDEWLLSFGAPARVWSTNDRIHFRTRASLTEKWRTGAKEAAKRIRQEGRWYVVASVPFRRDSRRDPHNFVSTVVKATIDGLTDAGWWPDDTTDYVVVGDPICRVCPLGQVMNLTMGVHGLRLESRA